MGKSRRNGERHIYSGRPSIGQFYWRGGGNAAVIADRHMARKPEREGPVNSSESGSDQNQAAVDLRQNHQTIGIQPNITPFVENHMIRRAPAFIIDLNPTIFQKM